MTNDERRRTLEAFLAEFEALKDKWASTDPSITLVFGASGSGAFIEVLKNEIESLKQQG
jgi:hypothetical protein